MKKIIETLHRFHHVLRGRDIVARFDTGAELVVYDRRLVNAVVVDCDGRQYTLGDYISHFVEQYPTD